MNRVGTNSGSHLGSLFQKHHYGDRVFLLDDAFHHSVLAKICHPSVHQPEINHAIKILYQQLLTVAVNNELSKESFSSATRMTEHHPDQLLTGVRVAPKQKLVCVDLMRAGIYPSLVCYEQLHWIVSQEDIRQDHIFASRVTDASDTVVGVNISAHKIGGDVTDSVVIFPDPMGATGTTLVSTIDFYKTRIQGPAKKYIALNLIVTPEYLKQVTESHLDLVVYAYRLDRGLSSKEVLSSELGQFWSQERGLNAKDYIVPGAGGFGEIMNNSFV